MSVTTLPAARQPALRRLVAIEWALFLRERTGPVFGLGLPVGLLVIFGNIGFYKTQHLDGLTLLSVYVPILVALVLGMLSLNVLPPTLAGYREKGVLRRMRTTPVGPARVLAAQLAIAVAVETVAITLLLVLARFAFGVVLPRQLGGFIAAAALAGLALLAIGLLVAAAAPTGRFANAAGAILFYPMVFFAGLFFPVQAMSPALQHVSHATPLGAAVEAFGQASAGQWPHLLPMVTMAAYAVACGLAAARLFRWE
jgi:ABC-2 type transport system permease protein